MRGWVAWRQHGWRRGGGGGGGGDEIVTTLAHLNPSRHLFAFQPPQLTVSPPTHTRSIDEEDETYRALHQSGRKSKALDRELVREHFVDVDGGDEEEEDEETSQGEGGSLRECIL